MTCEIPWDSLSEKNSQSGVAGHSLEVSFLHQGVDVRIVGDLHHLHNWDTATPNQDDTCCHVGERFHHHQLFKTQQVGANQNQKKEYILGVSQGVKRLQMVLYPSRNRTNTTRWSDWSTIFFVVHHCHLPSSQQQKQEITNYNLNTERSLFRL